MKHDIYRFLFLCIAFFAITSITQASSYGYKMLVIFGVSLKWHVDALQEYNENNFSSSSWKLFGVIMVLSISEVACAVYE